MQIVKQFQDKIKVFEKQIDQKDIENKRMEKEIESGKYKMESLKKQINSMEDMIHNIVEKVEKTNNLETLQNTNKKLHEKTRDCFKILASKIDEEFTYGR